LSKIICFEQNDSKSQGIWSLCKRFLQERNVTIPGSPTIIASIHMNEDKIVVDGVVGVENVFHIEPLVADNPSTALRLANICFGIALTSKCERIEAHVQDKNLDKMTVLLEKEGFVFTEKLNIFTRYAH